jgi:hypothetical protein
MRVRKAISAGLSAAFQTPWMVLLFYGANLLMAAAIAAPMHSDIADHIGNSMVGEELARGLSSAWLQEFQLTRAEFLKAFSIAITYAGILFLVINTVLSAGAFEVFARGPGAGMHAFGRGTGKYFARFVRIALAASVAYFLLFWLFNGPLARALEAAFRNSTVERWHFYLNWLRAALLVGLVLFVNAVVDYARAFVALENPASALAALGRGLGFMLRHFAPVVLIYSGVGVLTLSAIVVYAIFARYFPQNSVLTVLIWFLIAQALLYLRWTFRLSSWAAAVAYSRAQARIPAEITVTAEATAV